MMNIFSFKGGKFLFLIFLLIEELFVNAILEESIDAKVDDSIVVFGRNKATCDELCRVKHQAIVAELRHGDSSWCYLAYLHARGQYDSPVANEYLACVQQVGISMKGMTRLDYTLSYYGNEYARYNNREPTYLCMCVDPSDAIPKIRDPDMRDGIDLERYINQAWKNGLLVKDANVKVSTSSSGKCGKNYE